MKKRLFVLIFLVFLVLLGCPMAESVNNDPYPLVSPDTIDASSGDEVQTFQLLCDTNPDGTALYDEDGDPVTVVVDDTTPLPSFIELDTATGVLTVTRSESYTGTINFWTVDDQGGTTEGEALSVEFTVVSSGNQAPSVSFGDWDFEVSGADISAANDKYYLNGTSVGFDKYSGINGHELFFYQATEGNYWVLGPDFLSVKDTVQNTDYYNDESPYPDYPPVSGWLQSSNGLEIASLEVWAMPFTGDTTTIGTTITGNYVFSDPDGDSEGISLYQWYACDTSDSEGTAISGATDISFTTTASEDGKYLKIEVTPVDEYGAVGTPVKSEASREIGLST